jgi:hypothetical protein
MYNFKSPGFILVLLVFTLLTFNSCGDSSDPESDETLTGNVSEWLVPVQDIVGNFNPFPLAENPILSPVNSVEGLTDNSRVAIITFNGKVNIYPLNFIQRFETVNDAIDEKSFVISYCPITQSTIAIDRNSASQKLTLRASGILYKENLVMHDSKTNSFWSQMLLKKIKGDSQIDILATSPMIETSWLIAKTYFPDARVFTNKSIIAAKGTTASKSLESIDNDELVFSLIDNITAKKPTAFVYRYSEFEQGIQLFVSGSGNRKIVVGSADLKFVTAFSNDENIVFTPVQNEFPIVMTDEKGNKWNVFGEVESGPDKGKTIKPASGFVAAWWAWKSFYADLVSP